ncbi:MAG: DUF4382 domain-containing protein [Terracidiphilus sp.]
MASMTYGKHLPVAVVSFAAVALFVAGCGSGSTANNHLTPPPSVGSSFVVGTDAPLTVANVTSFTVPVESVTATDANNNTVQLVSGSPSVDFARFNGLQTLLDMNDVAVGTYTGISITLGAATVGYLNVPASGPPAIATAPVAYPDSASTYTYTQTLATPLVIAASSAPVGLRVDFDLRKSIQLESGSILDGSGNVDVTPTFDIGIVKNSDAGGYIDTLVAGVVSVGTQSFVVQGPHGENFTIDVSGTTEWENGESIGNLTTSSIVEVSGKLDLADQTLDADDVAILSQDGFYAAGQVTYVTPATGAAASFDLYVRGLLPTDTGLTLGDIATVDLSNDPKFFIYWMHNPLTELLFNSSQMMPGQHVSIGGPASGAASASDVTAKRVVLRQWGFNGTVTANNAAVPVKGVTAFQMQVNGFAGVLIPETVTVYCLPNLGWRNGLSGMSDLKVGDNVRVVGLLLNLSGQPVLVGHYVDALN